MIEKIKSEERPQPLVDLMSGPLIAAVEANNKMAQTQVDFLLSYCFTKNGDAYEPKTIEMSLIRNVITPPALNASDQSTQITPLTTTFNLPLLTIVPLNSLAVNHIDLKFEMDITDLETDDQGNPQLLGKLLQSGQEETGVKLAVSLNAAQLPLPEGVLIIIKAFTKNIEPITMPSI
jgi:hypothetical protein